MYQENETQEAPLRGVVEKYIDEATVNSPSITEENRDNALICLLNLLKGEIDQESALIYVQSQLSTSEPAEKVISIIRTSPKPIECHVRGNSNSSISSIKNRKHHKNWTNYEDQRLLAGIYRYGIESWRRISEFVGNGRTRAQCAQRWCRVLNPAIKKAPWSEEELQNLRTLVEIHGDKNWKAISHEMKTRSDVQCRYKYFHVMKMKKVSEIKDVELKTDVNPCVICSSIENSRDHEYFTVELMSCLNSKEGDYYFDFFE
ncbi:Myb-like DNA-binding domain containing protein [Tritrichomonas foetus]|uniref:Myb-like DNA-binding domain containing protein n=1 Tax=Tritrichomonas foetus TaxID=1144522 RepID=A0A1J4L338_9EUKA|nr:Myb-like DNA-binding domain containing protein [Tritrichomonas foetus]|eukprot:OHT16366.1 Myb-like DNA-binding domain containing protein [Tritrichomonas foetus]